MLNIPRLDYRGNFQSLFNFEGLIDSQERGISVIKEYGGVAQLGEHLLCKQGVIGSNPFISTTSCGGGKSRTKESDESKRAARGTRSRRQNAYKVRRKSKRVRTRNGGKSEAQKRAGRRSTGRVLPLRHGLIAQVVRAHA